MEQLICSVNDLVINQVKLAKIDNESILLFRLEEGFFATQARCTHLFRSMAKGRVEGGNIRCPLHRAKFCIKTGEVVEWANFPPGVQLLNAVRKEKALKTYTVTVKGEEVFVLV